MIGIEKQNLTTNDKPTAPCLAMRAREAAKALGVSERTLWDWTDKGQVPHIRRGRVVLYSVDALRQWLQHSSEPKTEIGGQDDS